MKRPILKADYESGEGKLVIPDDWLLGDPLMRADLLKDWMEDIMVAYDEAVEDFMAMMRKAGAIPDCPDTPENRVSAGSILQFPSRHKDSSEAEKEPSQEP